MFFFNDTATAEIYTLSLHDALPIFRGRGPDKPHENHQRARKGEDLERRRRGGIGQGVPLPGCRRLPRSEEHTSELQSRQYLVCRLLLEKKKTTLLVRSARA